MEKYKIIISEPWGWEHPDGGISFFAKGLGVVKGPDEPNWKSEYLLLEVIEPFVINNEKIKYIIVSPRYKGDTLNTIQEKECTVGIARFLPGFEISVGSQFSKEMIDYFAIGSIIKS